MPPAAVQGVWVLMHVIFFSFGRQLGSHETFMSRKSDMIKLAFEKEGEMREEAMAGVQAREKLRFQQQGWSKGRS